MMDGMKKIVTAAVIFILVGVSSPVVCMSEADVDRYTDDYHDIFCNKVGLVFRGLVIAPHILYGAKWLYRKSRYNEIVGSNERWARSIIEHRIYMRNAINPLNADRAETACRDMEMSGIIGSNSNDTVQGITALISEFDIPDEQDFVRLMNEKKKAADIEKKKLNACIEDWASCLQAQAFLGVIGMTVHWSCNNVNPSSALDVKRDIARFEWVYGPHCFRPGAWKFKEYLSLRKNCVVMVIGLLRLEVF